MNSETGSRLVEDSTTRVINQIASTDSRAVLISHSLKRIARRARTPKNVFVPTGGGIQRRWHDIFVWIIVGTFGLIVVLPNLVATVYLAFFVSDQYASETRFAVRGGEPNLLNLGGLVGMASGQRVQDSMIVADYIEGRGMVEAVDHALNLRKLFGRNQIDFFSRFSPKDSNEELLSYWKNHIYVKIDSMSGIITVVVRAFTPQDSLDITNKIVSLSETLVNDLTERSRSDALRRADAELARAKQYLQIKLAEMRNLRNAEGVLDSAKTGEVMTQMLGDLRLELIHLEQEYSAQRRTILPTSPQLRVLEARIDSMKDQIRKFEDQMTAVGPTAGPVLSESMSKFSRLNLEKDFAEKQYVAAAAAFESARIDLETQKVYLATFTKPVLSQEALYPKRFWLWSVVAFLSLLLWGGGVGTAVLVRNNLPA
jgi:capsular polysaccharide transport system permease protein